MRTTFFFAAKIAELDCFAELVLQFEIWEPIRPRQLPLHLLGVRDRILLNTPRQAPAYRNFRRTYLYRTTRLWLRAGASQMNYTHEVVQ